ncbi:YqhR family membrane protein [Paenibacillus radicis (ex Gao et al. 2016)]|uniref:Uncharacterized protein n=1 Tax=Paenibacillus radicis (ex Gao et al. 2016) TaxID=1737354 RepID=A0A917GTW5_9BACL|nr:YqhR family membrane protein [Paenibacillus radicis (ex Gao et al. 2016)]GGG56691.1 hypothetical protein GCM10010918_07090 [Paenibacillus radicis (ex Gao et al. 2016)]
MANKTAARKMAGSKDDRLHHHTNPFLFELTIGFFAGLIWGGLRWMLYEFKFTKELPGIMADPFFRSSFLKTYWGMAVGIGCYIVFSIIAAHLYYFLFRKLRGPWPGVLYGFLWWIIIFVFAGPSLHISQPIRTAGWNTFITELCIFLLWGLFIGYSTAFEFTDEASREPVGAH